MKYSEIFQTLRKVDVSPFVEKKGNLIYLSWAKAWELLNQYANTDIISYQIYENSQGFPYFTDGKYAWVKVSVTVADHTHQMILHVMNNMNKAVPIGNIDMGMINKTIMRCLTKAIAMHGLGLGLYIGEDLKTDTTNGFKIEYNDEI